MPLMHDHTADRLHALRVHVLRSERFIAHTGWQDLAEAAADLDVTAAALRLGQATGKARAGILLAEDGPLHELAQIAGWEADISATIKGGESAIAA